MGTRNESPSNERWIPVVGYEGWYDVSNHGRVRRVMAAPGAVAGNVLRQSNSHGYRRLMLCKDGIAKSFSVHCLVLDAFKGPRQERQEVNHLDGDKANNNVGNLEYVSCSDNHKHAYMTGLRISPLPRGHDNPSSKLCEQDVRKIRRLLKIQTQTKTAKQFGVSQPSIHHIRTGRNWGWLKDESAVSDGIR